MKFQFKNPFRKRENKKGETTDVKPIEQYYNRDGIDATNAPYRLIIGQRSNRQNLQCIKNYN